MKFVQFNRGSRRSRLSSGGLVVVGSDGRDQGYRRVQHMSTLLMSEVNPKGC